MALLVQKASGTAINPHGGSSVSFAAPTTAGNRVIVAIAWDDAQHENLAVINFSDGTANTYNLVQSAFGGGAGGIGPQVAILAVNRPGLSAASMQTLTLTGWNTTVPVQVWLYELSTDINSVWNLDSSNDLGPGNFANNNNVTLPCQPVSPLFSVVGSGGNPGFQNFYLAVEAADSVPVTQVGSSTTWLNPVSVILPYNPVSVSLPDSSAWTRDTILAGYNAAYIDGIDGDQQAIWCETEASYCSAFLVLDTSIVYAGPNSAPTSPCSAPVTTGQILVSKVTVPPGATQVFQFNPDYGAQFSLTDGGFNQSADLAPGTYSVTETPVTGWTTTVEVTYGYGEYGYGGPIGYGGGTNTDSEHVVVEPGDNIPVVFTNTQIPTAPPCGKVLTRVDTWEMDNGEPDWASSGSVPIAWYDSNLGQQRVGITRPIQNGTIGLLYIQLAQTLNGSGVAMTIPDDWTPYVLWGALADLLNHDGPAYDPVRGKYCEQRYQEGVELARLVLKGA